MELSLVTGSGLHSTAEGANAGLDLEMPGPPLHRGQKLLDAVYAGDVSPETIRERARNVLMLMHRTGGLTVAAPEETTRNDADDIAILREASAAGMVLLKNENSALPLIASGIGSIALIGPNAEMAMVMGGGSAHVTPTRVSQPRDAMEQRIGGSVNIEFAPGCNINKKLPELQKRHIRNASLQFFEDASLLNEADAKAGKTEEPQTFHIMWFGDTAGSQRKCHRFWCTFHH